MLSFRLLCELSVVLARVQADGTMLVAIGLGFYLELRYDEVGALVRFLRAKHTRRRDEMLQQESRLRAEMKIFYEGIQELAGMSAS